MDIEPANLAIIFWNKTILKRLHELNELFVKHKVK